MSSNQSGEGEIRKAIIEADLVDCMIALPGQLFYGSQIPVCLWFLARNKSNTKFRDRRKQTLFVDARKMGHLVDRVHRDLRDDEIAGVTRTYHAWRGETESGKYVDLPGFCKSTTIEEIAAHGHILTPGRYVGAEEVEGDDTPFEIRMRRLVAQLRGEAAEGQKLSAVIDAKLAGLGYGS
jgi:type I restriction enzyme M protein